MDRAAGVRWQVLLLVAVLASGCGQRQPSDDTLTSARAARVQGEVGAFMHAVARDVTAQGPAAWRQHFSEEPSFFMVADGQLVFPSGAAVKTAMPELIRSLPHIELQWGDDIRIDALTRPGLESDPIVAVGLLFLLVGFGFKMSLAPFHTWAPDVYAGMPTPAVTYLSIAPKGASLLVLYRVLSAVFEEGLPDRFRAGLAAVALLSMTLGNVVALAQRDIKRLLAYSGIAHMGYVTITLVVFGRNALAAAIVYLFGYLVSNAGAFAAVAALYRSEDFVEGPLAFSQRRPPQWKGR